MLATKQSAVYEEPEEITTFEAIEQADYGTRRTEPVESLLSNRAEVAVTFLESRWEDLEAAGGSETFTLTLYPGSTPTSPGRRNHFVPGASAYKFFELQVASVYQSITIAPGVSSEVAVFSDSVGIRESLGIALTEVKRVLANQDFVLNTVVEPSEEFQKKVCIEAAVRATDEDLIALYFEAQRKLLDVLPTEKADYIRVRMVPKSS